MPFFFAKSLLKRRRLAMLIRGFKILITDTRIKVLFQLIIFFLYFSPILLIIFLFSFLLRKETYMRLLSCSVVTKSLRIFIKDAWAFTPSTVSFFEFSHFAISFLTHVVPRYDFRFLSIATWTFSLLSINFYFVANCETSFFRLV